MLLAEESQSREKVRLNRWLWVLGVFAVLVACGTEGSESPPASVTVEAPPVQSTGSPAFRDPLLADSIVEAEVRRELSITLRSALRSDRVENRRASALALSRLRNPDVVSLLKQALRDPDVTTRSIAARGLGHARVGRLLSHSQRADTEHALIGALASERQIDVIRAILYSLGRIGGEAASSVAADALSHEAATIRESACLTWLELSKSFVRLAALPVAGDSIRRVAARMVDDPVLSVRRACSAALSMMPLQSLRSGRLTAVREDVRRALRDADAEVRVNAVRAAGRFARPERSEIEACALDPDWRVQIAAVQVRAQRISGDGSGFAAFMSRVIDRAGLPPNNATDVHVHRALIAAARDSAGYEPIRNQARRAMRGMAGNETQRDSGILHCEYAALADIGRGWPSDLDDCGFGHVSDERRRELSLEVVGAAEGSDADRAGFIQRGFRSESTAVRSAAVRAVSGLPVNSAVPQVLAALADSDLGVVNSGLLAIGTSERGRFSAHERGIEIRAAMNALLQRLEASNEVESILAWIDAIQILGPEAYAVTSDRLAREGHRAVRDALARYSDVEFGQRPVTLSAEVRGLSDLETVSEGVIVTSRGSIRIAFDLEGAPRTVANFQRLVAEGFYTDLAFHRDIPGVLIQGGDPRGDGYGGPGYSIPCEDGPRRYERGSLGMALSGRDTGGSQFFITHANQPNLDGDYTLFAQVIEGWEALEALQPRDRILRIELVSDDS